MLYFLAILSRIVFEKIGNDAQNTIPYKIKRLNVIR